MPGGHIRDYDVGGVEGEVSGISVDEMERGKKEGHVPVWVGRLDIISIGIAEHAVHGSFDIESLKSGPTKSKNPIKANDYNKDLPQ